MLSHPRLQFTTCFLRILFFTQYNSDLIYKMSAWRQAGLNYINYSNIAAKVLRKSLKPQIRTEALRRDESHVRITPWANGRPANEKE